MLLHRHHIFPRHMWPDGFDGDTPENIQLLTVAEHAEAHRLLWEQFGRWQDKCAWLLLSGRIAVDEALREMTRAAASAANRGKHVSAETRAKLSAFRRGKPLSAEVRAKMSISQRKPRTPEVLARMSASRIGRKHSIETRAKMSAIPHVTGRKPSAETRAKMSASHLEKTATPETRAKLSAMLLGNQRGKNPTAETRAKLSAAHRGRPKSDEHKAKIAAAHLRGCYDQNREIKVAS